MGGQKGRSAAVLLVVGIAGVLLLKWATETPLSS
jgi:hypothetical protein